MKRSAFTLVEILVGAAISSIIAVAIFSLMNAGMILSAKNLSINLTSNSMRGALDRVEQIVQRGDTMPTLIDNTGADVAVGPAAGIKFDLAIGSPYVVTLTAGSIPASSTILTLTRSTNSAASPPPPKPGDIIRIGPTLRSRIQSVSSGAVDGQSHQPFTTTLTAALGTTVTPTSGVIVTARIVRNVAIIVMPANGNPELRYYNTFDTTANLNDPANYVVITDQIGTASDDSTPFALLSVGGQSFVEFSLRVRASNADKGIRGRQNDQFNTYSRTKTLIHPKTVP